MNTPPSYCYKKKYIMIGPSAVLQNDVPAKAYVEEKINKLLSAESSTETEKKQVKRQILREFREIYEYDCQNAEYPEPFGEFSSDREKESFILRKKLIADFNLYLGNIFCNFHYNLYLQKKPIPILTSPRLVVDYDELYLRAAREYFGILMDVEYPLQLRPVGEPAKEKSMHACGTTFILPALIDHFLIMYLQNRLLFSGLSKIGSGGKVDVSELSQEEVWLYQAFTFGKLNGSAVFGGTQHQTMNKVYQMFVSHALIDDTKDKRAILTGMDRNKPITIGTILHSDYAEKEIVPEYFELLKDLFDVKRMNIRNCIMHGNSTTFDYLSINIAAVMLQLLWDIASGDIFE